MRLVRRMMNAKAQEIGATHTHFVNMNGMPDADHYSTARDMAKIAAYAMHNDAFRRIVGTKAKNIYYIAPQGHTTYCINTNELLDTYEGCTGIKTGWTSAARGCSVQRLSATAKRSSPSSCIPTMTRRASARQQPCSTTASSRKQSLHHLQQERRLRLHNKPSLATHDQEDPH